MRSVSIPSLGVWLLAAGVAAADPPPVAVNAPGISLGVTRSKWVAPYARCLLEGVGTEEAAEGPCRGIEVPTVRWYSEDGAVLHERQGVKMNSGYVSDRDGRVYGLFPYWEATVHRKGEEDASRRSTSTGRVFLHVYHPTLDEVSVDVYHVGRLVRTVGPFQFLTSETVRLNESGSFAIVARHFEKPDTNRVVLVDPRGSVTADLVVPIAAGSVEEPDPVGRGVLVRSRAAGTSWIEPGEPPRTLDVEGSWPTVVVWADDGLLFLERRDEGSSYAMVDLDTGRVLWRIPGPSNALGFDHIAAADGDWIYLYDRVIDDRSGLVPRGRHQVSVVSAASGDTLHVWTSSVGQPLPEPANLLKIDGEIYFVTDSDFTRLDRERVMAGRSRWSASQVGDR